MNDKELIAMQSVINALDDLDEDAQKRVVNWAAERLRVSLGSAASATGRPSTTFSDAGITGVNHYGTFAELFDALTPRTNPDKVMAASYWLQVHRNQEQFTAQSVNKELQDLGYGLKNVTQAFTALKDRKPALAIQVRKSGKSPQARKLYKLTRAGIDVVNAMLQGKLDE